MRNILIFADLTSPLMFPRIKMLESLPYNKYILHNANNSALSSDILEKYKNFIVLEHPKINNVKLRYFYSFFYTLFLLLRLSPKLIVVHWASRLCQNLLLALWGKRVIVHTMGGDIDGLQDFRGLKKKLTSLLLRYCKIVTIKSHAMYVMLDSIKINKNKIFYLSWGVEDRFKQKITEKKKIQLQRELFGTEFRFLFFSIRAFTPFYHQKEIITSFLDNFVGDLGICLLVSDFRKDSNYLHSIQNTKNKNIIFRTIAHTEMDRYLASCDCVISYSESDGFSQSIMEAVSLCKWVLTNGISHHNEILSEGDNAIGFNGDLELKSRLKEMLSRAKKKPKNSKNVVEFLDYHTQKQRYLKILKEFFDV